MSAVEKNKILSIEEMEQEEEQVKLEEISRLIEKNHGRGGMLIQVLHSAQEIYGYLPLHIQEIIAKGLNMPLSEVSGVVTFYTLFSTTPRADHAIRVCMGTACYVRGGQRIVDRLEEELGILAGETTEDRKFSIEICRCLGACGLAPVMTIDEDVHQQVNPDKIEKILTKY
jgi:NADH:ubiquinone oxidoreductase subunit E